MEGISLGSAYLRLYGDRSALDRELEKLKRYTDQLEKQGIKVKFDADTGKATREVDGLQNKLNQLNRAIQAVGQGMRGDSGAWGSLGDAFTQMGKKAAAGGGAMGALGGALGSAAGMATKAIPILGQLGMAAMGVQAIFHGVAGAINGVLAPLKALASEAGRFNQQVAEGSIFAAQSFAVLGPDGKAIQGTANQMRALRGTITKEYKNIQKEVATISGATSAEIYEGFNLILQNAGALGKEGESLENVSKLATRVAAAMNTLGVPGDQLRSEVTSLMTGDVQINDQLSKKLGYDRPKIEKLKAEGKFYEDLMQRLEKLYDGQAVLADSLSNVSSNFADVFQTISVEGGTALERGLGKGLKNVLDPLTELQGSFASAFRGISETLEPVLRVLGEIAGWFVSIGSIIGSSISVIGDFAALTFNLIEALASPILRGVGKILQVIAKAFELCATAVSSLLRPVSTFFRIFTNTNTQDIDSAFDPILNGFDDLIAKAEKAAAFIAKPFAAFLKYRAWVEGKNKGKSEDEIKLDQANIDSQFDAALGSGNSPTLRSLNFSSQTQALLADIDKRYSGTQEEVALAHQREMTQLVQDRIKNEIGGLENVLKLMQSQKSVQEALNGLAEARRGLTMQRATFQTQVASSPEAKAEAQDRQADLANRQEQERIKERKALLGTERQMLQVQLEIQIKQQRIQQDQLAIQREEIRIQLIKAKAAQLEASTKMRNAPAGSPEQASLREKFIALGKEAQLRQKQLDIMDQTIGIARQTTDVTRRSNALAQSELGIKAETLGVESQRADLTLQQQKQLSAIEKKEQAIRNTAEESQRLLNKEISDEQKKVTAIEDQLKLAEKQTQIDKGRLDLKKAQLEAMTQAAEQELKVAEAQQEARDNPTSVRAVIGAQIEALATGQRGQRDVLSATKAVYDAKERQMKAEHEMQRAQLKIQQQREDSERRIALMRLKIEELSLRRQVAEEKAAGQLLQVRQDRDQLAGGVVGAASQRGDTAVLNTGSVNANDPTLRALANTPAVIGAVGRCTYNVLVNAMEKIGARSAGRVKNQLMTDSSVGTSLGDGNDPRNAVIGLRKYGWVPLPGAGRKTTLRNSAGSADVNLMTGEEYSAMANAGKIPSGALMYSTRHSDPNGGSAGSRGYDLAVAQNGGRAHNNSQKVNSPLVYGGSTKWVAVLVPKESITQSGTPAAATAASQALPASSRAPAATPGTAPSLQVAVEASADKQENTNDLLQRIADLIKNFYTDILQPSQQAQGLESQTLQTQQDAQERSLAVERRRAELTSEFLEMPGNRFAADVAESLSSGVSGAIRGALQRLRTDGSIDFGDFMQEVMGGIADRIFETALNAVLAPMEKALTETLFKGFTGFDEQKIEERLAAEGLTNAATAHQEAAGALQQAAGALQQASPAQQGAGALPGIAGSEAMSIPVVPFGGQAAASAPNSFGGFSPFGALGFDPSAAFGVATEAGTAFADSMSNVNDSLAKAPTAAQEANKGMQNFLGGMAGVAAGAMAIAGGIQQIGKGGTSNVLGGIGSVMMGLGGALGGLGGMGLFGKRAAGGPVAAQRPYMVGERGPELFMPGTSGSIGSASALRDAMASGGGGGGGSPVLNMSFQSTNIGGTEYVDRAQLEQAMAETRRSASRDGARRGMSMTLDKLQQSPATRSRLGIR